MRDADRPHRDITSLKISDDGRTLYTAGLDSRTIVWDIASDRRLAHAFAGGNATGENFPPALALSPDGRRFARDCGAAASGTHTRTLRSLGGLPGIEGRIATAVEYSPDGRAIAVTGTGGSVEVRDAHGGRRVRARLPGLSTGVGAPGKQRGSEPGWDAQARTSRPEGSGSPLRTSRVSRPP